MIYFLTYIHATSWLHFHETISIYSVYFVLNAASVSSDLFLFFILTSSLVHHKSVHLRPQDHGKIS
uniref:Macaca fascicularis brain cDNA, clone: QflA-10377 n=1 Tax=Macaca fascicularis TaxID=9541 RepID=I7GLS2_MACFA|nr:unnamed protein product [Macaca fascicularis]